MTINSELNLEEEKLYLKTSTEVVKLINDVERGLKALLNHPSSQNILINKK